MGYRKRSWVRVVPIVVLACAPVWIALAPPAPVVGGEGTDAAEAYAGERACKPCHEEEYERWANSNHAHTSKIATADFLPECVVKGETAQHPPRTTTFRRTGDRFVAVTAGPDGKPTEYPLSLVVGRARIRMFVTQLPDGRYQVLPGMLEAPLNEWFDFSHLIFGAQGLDWDTPPEINPGDPSFWTGAVRSWGAHCANCHASGARFLAVGKDGKGPRAEWRDTGVDCEACHGPGKSHVEAWTRKQAGSPLPPLERLGTAQANEICLICHMEHEVIVPGYKVGKDLFEHIDPTLLLSPERVDPAGRPLELIYEGLSFLTSRCATQGNLRCVTCHEPHGSGVHGQLHYPTPDDKLCAKCHEKILADPKAHTHHDPKGSGGRCIACHMPKLPAERGHGVITDHTIGIPMPGLRADRAARDACRWCHAAEKEAPKGAPLLSVEEIRRSFEAWWPKASELPRWVDAIARARLGEKDVGPTLVKVFRNRRNTRVIRASAVRLMGPRSDVDLSVLMEALRSGDSLVRRSAVRALGARTGEAVDAALLRALTDESTPVRVAAARTALAGWARVQKNKQLLRAILPVLEADCKAVPNDDLRWFRLGGAREVAGDRAGAIDAYERQVALDSLAHNIRRHLKNLKKPKK